MQSSRKSLPGSLTSCRKSKRRRRASRAFTERSRIFRLFRLTATSGFSHWKWWFNGHLWLMYLVKIAMTRVSVFQTQSLNAEFSLVMIVYSSRSKFMIHNENKPKELRKNGLPCPSQIFWKYPAEHKHDTPRSYLDPFSTEAASTRLRTCGTSLTLGD